MMRNVLCPGCAVMAGLSLVFAGCAQQTADQAFTVSQIDTSRGGDGTVRIKLTTPGDVAEADESALVAYVQIVAVRAATRRQREITEQRGRSTQRKLQARAGSVRKSRYLAVATEPGVRPAGKKVAKSVMIWDTQSETIVGNNVYDIQSTPPVGSVARFETYSAEYVGAGL